MVEWVVAAVLGVIQGILEWLPVSSEGTIALVLAALDAAPDSEAQFALFLHAGTGLAATVYYRDELSGILRDAPSWRPGTAFDGETAALSFFAIATAVSVVVGLASYLVLEKLASAVAGGAFVAVIGALLVGTGILMRTAESRGHTHRETPGPVDAVLVGALQGVAVLPGVSRSGTTVSALLLRGHDGADSLRLSFVLSVPAAFGAGLLVVLDDGLPTIDPGAATLALALAAVVGYLTVDALVRVVERVSFWKVCVGFGALAMAGGGLLLR
jgi:undecaprenyl-diphosphatase